MAARSQWPGGGTHRKLPDLELFLKLLLVNHRMHRADVIVPGLPTQRLEIVREHPVSVGIDGVRAVEAPDAHNQLHRIIRTWRPVGETQCAPRKPN